MSEFTASPGPVLTPGMSLRNGPPWEDKSKPVFQRWMETVKGVFAEPDKFFRIMRQEGGIGAPLAFGVIGGSLGIIIAQIYSMIFHVGLFSLILSAAGKHEGEKAAVQLVGNIFMDIGMIVFAPFLMAVGLFIGAAILHLLLMLFGGANKSFETTFRVYAYSSGALSLLLIIPICGNPIVAVWSVIVEIIGLARAHETTMGKSALAVLAPLVLCICCAIFVGVLFGAAIIALVSAHS